MCRAWSAVILALAVLVPFAGRASAATRYDGDGVLTSRGELQRWYINRARFAPEKEADRLGLNNTTSGGHPDYDVCEDNLGTNDFGTTTNQWAPWRVSHPPLAPNALISTACQKHSQDMAETRILTHYSPSTNYYALNSAPWTRAAAEGYSWSAYAENIGYGFSTPASLHNALFVDSGISNRGHRMNILNTMVREVGFGSGQTNGSSRYDTQDFGRRSTNHFFTDTAFGDVNTNNVYDEGEGAGGIEVHLWNGTNEALWFDVSTTSGSFAIPINDLPDGKAITTELRNTNGTARLLTIPMGFNTVGDVTLAPGESFVLGTFTQPNGLTNIGFRDVMPFTDAAAVTPAGTNILVSFAALSRASYVIESADASLADSWHPFDTQIASNGAVQFTDCGQCERAPPNAVGLRFYRVRLNRD